MKSRGLTAAILAAALLLAGVVWRLAAPGDPARIRARLSLSGALSPIEPLQQAGPRQQTEARENTEPLPLTGVLGDVATDGFEHALETRSFSFPADHGPHPGFQTEWWYFTGNLETPDGQAFGYQLTLFSQALVPDAEAPIRTSAWATSRVFMGHLGLTDIDAGTFHSHERFSRAALGLAGAEADPLHVWLEDWSLSGGREGAPFSLEAAAGEVSIQLALSPDRPVVLQGDRGLSHKGGGAGNASYYYSITRLRTAGRLRIGAEEYKVRGLSWMDREWSTSSLGPDLSGWDWFAVQLDDGSDLMFYRLRRRDGSIDPASAGSLVAADGTRRPLTADDVDIDATATWKSPHTGANYPAGWTLRVRQEGLELHLEPRLADQEHDLSVLYWEGAIRAEGTRNSQPITGQGYVELTGYQP